MYVWVTACMYMYHIPAWWPQRPEEGVRVPGTEVTGGVRAAWCTCWGPNPSPLKNSKHSKQLYYLFSPCLSCASKETSKEHIACLGSHWYWGAGVEWGLKSKLLYAILWHRVLVWRSRSGLRRMLQPGTEHWGRTHTVPRATRSAWHFPMVTSRHLC